MADIGANPLFLSAYYGLSLLWDEYAATGSTDMKFVPYDGTSVVLNPAYVLAKV